MAVSNLRIPDTDGSRFRVGSSLFEYKTKPAMVQFTDLLEEKEITRIDFRDGWVKSAIVGIIVSREPGRQSTE